MRRDVFDVNASLAFASWEQNKTETVARDVIVDNNDSGVSAALIPPPPHTNDYSSDAADGSCFARFVGRWLFCPGDASEPWRPSR
jgi:hypothetical protein